MDYGDKRDFGFTRPFDNLVNLENMGFNVITDLNRSVQQVSIIEQQTNKNSEEQKG